MAACSHLLHRSPASQNPRTQSFCQRLKYTRRPCLFLDPGVEASEGVIVGENAREYIADDEFVKLTLASFRLRKRLLKYHGRKE
jgi:predicted membrane GTPase involved in stress response